MYEVWIQTDADAWTLLDVFHSRHNAIDLFVRMIGGTRDRAALAALIECGGVAECVSPNGHCVIVGTGEALRAAVLGFAVTQ